MFVKFKRMISGLFAPEPLILASIFIVSLIFYVLTLKGIPGNLAGNSIKNNLDQVTKPFELSPERGRYLMLLAIAENKSFSLSKPLADAAYPDVGYYDGRFYVFFAPGISLLAAPLYLLGKTIGLAQVLSFFTISIFASLNLVYIYLISRKILSLPIWASLMAVLTFGFASTAWSYAVTLYQHHVTTFFILSGFYAIWKYKKQAKYSWIYALYTWLAFACAIGIDYPNAILMFPVMVYFFISSLKITQEKTKTVFSLRPSLVITSVIFAIIMLLHGYFNYTNFGGWTRLSGSLPGYKAIVEQNLLQKKGGQQAIQAIAKRKQPVSFFKEESFTMGSYILTLSRDRGLLLYTPLFIFGFLGLIYATKQINTETAVLFGIVAADIFLYSSWSDPWGGYAFGPRYLIPAMSVLSIYVSVWLTATKQSIIKNSVAFILFAYSVGVSLVGVLTTNAIPPEVEAIFLKTKFNYLLNIDYLIQGKSSSYIFNTYIASHMSLFGYYLAILGCMLSLAAGILFILPFIKLNNFTKLVFKKSL